MRKISTILTAAREAVAQLDAILRMEPRSPDALYERGIVNERLGKHQAADADFHAFLNIAAANDPRRAALLGTTGNSQ